MPDDRGGDRRGAQRAAPALHLCVHDRRHRPDPRRHHRRLRRQGVRRADRRRSATRVAILAERLAKTGGELNEARLRMARIPAGADLVAQQGLRRAGLLASATSSSWPACPPIMQAMLDEVAPKLKTGAKLLSETIRADAEEGDIGTPLGESPRRIPSRSSAAIRSSTTSSGPTPTSSCARAMPQKLAAAKAAVEAMLAAVRAQARRQRANPSHGEFEYMAKARAPPTPGKDLPGVLGPVPPRRARARLAAAGGRAVRRASSASPAAGWCRRRSSRASSTSALIETVCIASYHDYKNQGDIEVLKGVAAEITSMRGEGKGVLIVDDLVDTGKTAQRRARAAAGGAFRHGLRQADGPAAGRHLRHRSLAGHLDLFPLGHGLAFVPPIREGGD